MAGTQKKSISAEIPDWSREKIQRYWDPGRKLLRTIRRFQAAKARGGPLAWIRCKYWSLQHLFWSTITQSEIHLKTEIAGGLMLPHPTGIVLHPKSKIGPNCLIFHQVTFAGPVEIGGHVDIGAGAKVLAPAKIGDHAVVGANAVVTADVPARAVVAGVPAKVLSIRDDGST